MNNSEKYRVQTKVNNPEVIVAHTGKAYRWIDSSAFRTIGPAKAARRPDQRIIRICTPSEGALLQDTGAYRGRRFNIVVSAEVAVEVI